MGPRAKARPENMSTSRVFIARRSVCGQSVCLSAAHHLKTHTKNYVIYTRNEMFNISVGLDALKNFYFDFFTDEKGGENVAKLNQIAASTQLSTEIGHDTALSEIILLGVRRRRSRCSIGRDVIYLRRLAAFSE
jgi:hypothetical protein